MWRLRQDTGKSSTECPTQVRPEYVRPNPNSLTALLGIFGILVTPFDQGDRVLPKA
jgi:hypothetical protein